MTKTKTKYAPLQIGSTVFRTKGPLKEERQRYVTEQSALDAFWDTSTLEQRFGYLREQWPVAWVMEHVTNSLDDFRRHSANEETHTVTVALGADWMSVEDDGSSIPSKVVKGILNFNETVSSNLKYRTGAGGKLGHAGHGCIAVPYVFDKTKNAAVEVSIENTETLFTVFPGRDRAGLSNISPSLPATLAPSTRTRGTVNTVRGWVGLAELPTTYLGEELSTGQAIKRLVQDFSVLNPDVNFVFTSKVKGLASQKIDATNPTWHKWSTSGAGIALWYPSDKFQEIVENQAKRNVLLEDFIGTFDQNGHRRFTKSEIAGILSAADLQAERYVSDLLGGDRTKIDALLAAMKEKSDNLDPKELGLIGTPEMLSAVENLYGAIAGTQVHKRRTVTYADLPLLAEGVFAESAAQRRVVVGINGTPAITLPRVVEEWLNENHIKEDAKVSLLLNLVCPYFHTIDSSKSATLVIYGDQKSAIKTVLREVTEAYRKPGSDDVFESKQVPAEFADIMAEFSDEDRRRFTGKRKAGGQSKGDTELFARRDAAVVRLFNQISRERPQTKRHAYYVAKHLGLCGADHGENKDGSTAIAEIITKACWDDAIKWDRVLDNTRSLNVPKGWDSAEMFLSKSIPQFDVDMGLGQRVRLVVCTEKDAMIESVASVCEEEHIPSMSFHGQASEGAVYKLAEHISKWKGEVDEVRVGYLGDHDLAGLTIDSVVFAGNDKFPEGKLKAMLDEFFPGSPRIVAERLGITKADLSSPENVGYLMALPRETKQNKKQRDEYVASSGTDQTLGIDILSTEEIEERLRAFIARFKDPAVWAARKAYRTAEQAKLSKFVTDGGIT